jgi:hypothetical protein
MPVLKSLAFTAMPKTASDPVHIRRAKFIEKLEEQKLLLQDPAYIRTVQRMAEVDGQKQPVVRKQRVKPWWKTDSTGQIVMSIKSVQSPSSSRRQSWHRRPVQRQAAWSHRHTDFSRQGRGAR